MKRDHRGGEKRLLRLVSQTAMEAAAYHCQHSALNLKTWQEPPCVGDENDPNPRDPGAQKLLREMLQHHISRFEPDPLAALRQASRRKRSG